MFKSGLIPDFCFMRKVPLATGEIYHIFNRGVDKRKIFNSAKDYERFILSMLLMNDEQDGLMIRWRNYRASHSKETVADFLRLNLSERSKLVDFVAYCLNPNHFHFILKQLAEKGIERFMQRISTGYTMYFNERNSRSGSLFQGRFKSTHLDSNELLLHVGVYVNCNSEIHKLEKAEDYPWCSFSDYLGERKDSLVELDKKIILGQFSSPTAFREFSYRNIKHFQDRKADEKTYLE